MFKKKEVQFFFQFLMHNKTRLKKNDTKTSKIFLDQ